MSQAKSKRPGQSPDAPRAVLKYKPQGPTLQEFQDATEFIRLIIGPLGSGKTFGAIHCLLHCIHNQVPDKQNVRRSRWCVARNTFPDLNAATIPDFRSITDRLPFGEFKMGSPPTWSVHYARKDGTEVKATIMFRSFDGPQDVVKARGMQLSGVWVDELAEFNKANFDMLVGRVKRYPPRAEVPYANFHVLGTSNACSRDHWLAALALGSDIPNWWIGIQPPAVERVGNTWKETGKSDNYKNLPPGYYQDQIGGKKESWIRQNLANEFVAHSDGRPIHPDFNERIHVGAFAPTPGLPLHLGMDWGRTPACVVLQHQPNGQWLVLREICLVNAGADKLGTRVKTVLNAEFSGYKIAEATGDPSGEAMAQTQDETPFDLFQLRSELSASPASTNDPAIRYAALDELLGTLIGGNPAIMVDAGCTTLIRGLAGEYCFRRIQVTGDDRYKDNPDKGPTSHVCEALHYGLMGGGQGENLFDDGWDDMYDDIESWATPDHVYE